MSMIMNKTNKTLKKEKQNYFKWLNKNGYTTNTITLIWYYNRKKQIKHYSSNNIDSYQITIKNSVYDVNYLLTLFQS